MSKPVHAQLLRTPAGEELVVLAKGDYDALLASAATGDAAAGFTPEEDAADLAAVAEHRAAKERGERFSVPSGVMEAILGAESPVGPLRRWRGMTQAALAARAGIAQSHLSQIERGKRGGLDSLKKLARALAVPLSVLVDD